MNWWLIWMEVKPILGPLIQALVVLAVGIFTIKFQLRQANTAERKLFTDIHDKRYKALTSFTRDVEEMVLEAIGTDDAITSPTSVDVRLGQQRVLYARMQELEWLFGEDLMVKVSAFYNQAQGILNLIDRLRHNLSEDDAVALTTQINVHNDAMYDALAAIAFEARSYLYVGNIKTNAKDEEKEVAVVHVPRL